MGAIYDLYTMLAGAMHDAVTDLKNIDVDLGQLKKGGEQLPMDYPALIIRIENIYWKPHDSGKQKGLVHLRLKIIYPFTDETEYYERAHAIRTEVGTFFTLIDEIHNTVKDIGPSNYTKIVKFNEHHLDSKPEAMQWVYCLDYYCNIFSDSSSFEDGGMTIDFDYDQLLHGNAFLERTNDGRRVG